MELFLGLESNTTKILRLVTQIGRYRVRVSVEAIHFLSHNSFEQADYAHLLTKVVTVRRKNRVLVRGSVHMVRAVEMTFDHETACCNPLYFGIVGVTLISCFSSKVI